MHLLNLLDSNANNPASIEGLQWWLAAGELSSITKDGSNDVSEWRDLSGNGLDATQGGTAAQKPDYQSTNGGRMKGNGTSAFFTAGDILQSTLTGADKKFTIAIAFHVVATSTAGLLMKFDTTDGKTILSRIQAAKLVWAFSFNAAGTNLLTFTGTTSLVTLTDYYMILTYDGSDDTASGANRCSIEINGASETLTPSLTGVLGDIWDSNSSMGIMAAINGSDAGVSNFNDGAIYDIAVFDRIITAGEKLALGDYYASRYGIT